MPSRRIILILAVLGAFGVLVPMYKRMDFLDPRLIVAYACLSAVIAASSVADAFTPGAAGTALGRMIRVWLYSWGLAVLLLFAALLTVNVRNWYGHVLLPHPASFLIACECISATASAAVVALGAVLTRRFSGGSTKTVFRTLFLLAILALVLADRYGVETATTAAFTRWLFILSAICGAAAVFLASRYPRTERQGHDPVLS
jgi:hypothetical protein